MHLQFSNIHTYNKTTNDKHPAQWADNRSDNTNKSICITANIRQQGEYENKKQPPIRFFRLLHSLLPFASLSI